MGFKLKGIRNGDDEGMIKKYENDDMITMVITYDYDDVCNTCIMRMTMAIMITK